MEKIKVNNQIVSMRKFIKQAKVHILNKLVKDVKSLKLKKGTDEQLEKNKRKSEKLLAEIEIIKKLPVDTLCKRTLIKEKDWESILSDKSSTIEERSFALVANFNAVQSTVKKFHDTEPHLASILPDLLLQWEQRKNDPSEKHFKGMKASEFRKQKREKLKGKRNQKVKSAPSFSKKAKVMDLDNSVDAGDAKVSENPEVSTHSSSEEVEGNVQDDHNAKDSDSEITKKDVPSIIPEKKQKKEKQVAVLDLNELKEDESIPLGSATDNEDEDSDVDPSDNKNDITRVKNDPFFGEVNEEAEEGIRRLEKMNSSSGRPSRGFGRGSRRGGRFNRSGPSKPFADKRHGQFKGEQGFRSGPPRRSFGRSRGGASRGGDRFQQSRQGNQQFGDKKQNRGQDRSFTPKSFSKDFVNKERPNVPLKQNTPKATGSLHPSWEAKKKMKMQCSIVPSQSKRIKFDD